MKECLWFKNYQQRNVFTSNGGSNEKLSLKLAVPKFRKWSFQFIFTRNYIYTYLRIQFLDLYKNLPFQQNPLKKPLTKLSFSDVAGLKPITLRKNESIYIESLSAVILEIYLLRNSSKQRHVKIQPCMTVLLISTFIIRYPWMTVLVLFSWSPDAILTSIKLPPEVFCKKKCS